MVGLAGNWNGTVSKRAQGWERRSCWGCGGEGQGGGDGQGGGEDWGAETPHAAGGGGSSQWRKHLKIVSCSCFLEDQKIQLEQDIAVFSGLKDEYEKYQVFGLHHS